MTPPNLMYCQNTEELNFCSILQHKKHDFYLPFLRDTVQLNNNQKITQKNPQTNQKR